MFVCSIFKTLLGPVASVLSYFGEGNLMHLVYFNGKRVITGPNTITKPKPMILCRVSMVPHAFLYISTNRKSKIKEKPIIFMPTNFKWQDSLKPCVYQTCFRQLKTFIVIAQ